MYKRDMLKKLGWYHFQRAAWSQSTVGIAEWREVCDVAAEARLHTETELALNEEVHKVLRSASKSNLLDLRGS